MIDQEHAEWLDKEVTRLKRDAQDAQRMLVAAVIATGGVLTIPRRVLVEMPRDWELWRVESPEGIIFSTSNESSSLGAKAP